MKAFNKIYSGLDVSFAIKEIKENDHLFNQVSARKEASPIHAQMTDIWLRFGDISQMQKTGDWSKVLDEHDSIWLQHLPHCKRLCFDIMQLVDGERLGGVLITKLPAGGKILPHADSGWHAEYYDKFYVALQNERGSKFCFESGEIDPDVGDVWCFDNSVTHWVENNTDTDRLAMVVCIKQSKYNSRGFLCLGE